QENAIAALAAAEDLPCLRDPVAHQGGRALPLGSRMRRLERCDAFALRVGLGDRVAQALSAEDEHEPLVLHWLHEDLDARELDRTELLAKLRRLLGRQPAGPAVGDEPLGI